MKEVGKSHYRKVFKSDHLGVSDLEEFLELGKRLIFTISEVRQEFNVMVAGRVGNYNIAYFKEQIKPLVLNSTNSKVLKGFCNSSFVEDWKNIPIELYIDENIRMKGEVVGGVRIKNTKPRIEKPVLCPTHPKWDQAKEAVKNQGSTKETIRKHWDISDDDFDKLCG